MGHLPSRPRPLGGKREWQEAPACASCPGRKGEAETPARTTAWLPPSLGEREGICYLSGCMPGGRDRRAGRCLGEEGCPGRFGEVGSRSQDGGISLRSLVQNFVGHGSCPLAKKFWNDSILEGGTGDRRSALAGTIFGAGFRPVRVWRSPSSVAGRTAQIHRMVSVRVPDVPSLQLTASRVIRPCDLILFSCASSQFFLGVCMCVRGAHVNSMKKGMFFQARS